ncbi:MAG: HAMP domain-containing sensor histidine kinase [Rhodomicrobiaceae bacterium]
MSRLYLRIYLAVLASLLVFALLAGLGAAVLQVFDEDHGEPWPHTGAEIAERLLPADRGPAELSEDLAFWSERTGYALMLVAPDGSVIAKAGDMPAGILARLAHRPDDGPHNWLWRHHRGRLFGLTFKDGRRLIALRPSRPFDWFRHLRWLSALVGIALAVGIAAYPLVRQLTRRLERLEQGVAAFGAGDLSTSVAVSGRDEIAELAKTFNAAADRIEALLNAHRTLLANASHELRSPLSRLRMAIEQAGKTANAAPAYAEMTRNIEELDTLVSEILLASRLQAGAAADIKPEPVDLVGLLAEECAHYQAELNAADAAAPIIEGDARLIRRLFRNLLENAARYGGSGSIGVTVRADAGMARVAVCDRGPGVPGAEREKIFEPFYRLKTMPESAGGAGLGLALVKQIAERHGGRVRCLPREGGGACFEVSLPAMGGCDVGRRA